MQQTAVMLYLNVNGPIRGETSIILCSPAGICSEILPKRAGDFISCQGYHEWSFMSVEFWGEKNMESQYEI